MSNLAHSSIHFGAATGKLLIEVIKYTLYDNIDISKNQSKKIHKPSKNMIVVKSGLPGPGTLLDQSISAMIAVGTCISIA